MTTPNPFDAYRLLGCYGAPADVLPDLPWWRSIGVAIERVDGVLAPTAAGARRADEVHPLPVPPVLPGQVWAPCVERGHNYTQVTAKMGDAAVLSVCSDLSVVEKARTRTLYGPMPDGLVLVYGPGAPWAPPEWAPGKVWDGAAWGEPVPEGGGQSWPGPWERRGRTFWQRWWPSGRVAVDSMGGVFRDEEQHANRPIRPWLQLDTRASGILTADEMRDASWVLAAIVGGEDPHPIPAELLGEKAHEALPPAARERFPLAIRLGGDDSAARQAEAEDLLRRADIILNAANVALAKAGITLDCPEDFGAWIDESREAIGRAVDRMEGEE